MWAVSMDAISQLRRNVNVRWNRKEAACKGCRARAHSSSIQGLRSSMKKNGCVLEEHKEHSQLNELAMQC